MIRIDNAAIREAEAPHERELIGAPMSVSDIMTRTLITLSPNQSMADAASLLNQYAFRHFLVVEAGGKLAGVISDRDILRAHAVKSGWHSHPVSEFMTAKPSTVTEDVSLSVAADLMVAKRINCLPVVDACGLVSGIVTSTDLLKTYRQVQRSIERNAHL
ncbi:MAG: CBS domain-containing protein [Deltaproteobacteria bacterium]|nr:CBS domain-containing protein [Deltaproteobacteria bacterium]MBM4299720.1 CBS domain-containing protein [Deltaproteobacteria bacterium]